MQNTFNTPSSLKSTVMMLKRTRTYISQTEERIADLEKNGFKHTDKFDIMNCRSVSDVIAKASSLLTDHGDIKLYHRYYHDCPMYDYAATKEEVAKCIKKTQAALDELKAREAFYEKLLTDKAVDIQRLVGGGKCYVKQLETV